MKKRSRKFIGCVALIFIVALGAVFARNFLFRTPRPNLILISIDTLRADRLGAYGYSRPTSPALNAFAKESVVFRNTVSVAPWTLPSHVTMFTGLYPASHGVVRSRQVVPSDMRMFAQIVQAAGYHTVAFTGGGYISRQIELDRGFDAFSQDTDLYPQDTQLPKEGFDFGGALQRAEKVIEASRNEEQPYFLFLHTYYVHCPYSVPIDYQALFRSGAEYVDPDRCGRDNYNSENITPSQGKFLSDQYDASIRVVDDRLRSFFEFLRAQPHYKNTIVIVTSDHGEDFLEHGGVGHLELPYRELLMVPLIVHAPGFVPKEITHAVSLVDLFPTMLDLLHVPLPGAVDGYSLKPDLERGDDAPARRNFQIASMSINQATAAFSMVSGDLQLIVPSQGGGAMLFDTRSDPLEQNNLCPADRRCGDLRAKLMETFGKLKPWHSTREGAELSDLSPELERLKSLGYMK